MTALELFSQGFGDIIKRKILWFSLFPKHFLRAGVTENTRSGIEVVITGLTRNQFGSNPTRVRIPPAAPKETPVFVLNTGDFTFYQRQKAAAAAGRSRSRRGASVPPQTPSSLRDRSAALKIDLDRLSQLKDPRRRSIPGFAENCAPAGISSLSADSLHGARGR